MDGQCNHCVTLLRQEDQSKKRQYNKRERERERERERGRGKERERERGAMLPALEMENGVRSQGVQSACRSWKCKEMDSSLEPLEGIQLCQHLEFRAFAPQKCKRINLCSFKALSV